MTLNRKAFGIAEIEPTKPRISDAHPPETPQSRRHGAPAGRFILRFSMAKKFNDEYKLEGPWPWVDFDHISPENPPDNATLPKDWKGYPQSLVRPQTPNTSNTLLNTPFSFQTGAPFK